MGFASVIEDAVKVITGNEQQRERIAKKLFALRQKDLSKISQCEVPEAQFISSVPSVELSGKIAGVDSGFLGKSLHSIDIVLVRAVGVVFGFQKGIVKKADYYPNFFSFPTPHITNLALDNDEFECSKSLLRLREEIGTAKRIIEKYSPEYCLLDGSIIPQYADKPRSNSPLASNYYGIINDFQSLYETAEKNNCELVACVEDSRGSRFRTILQETILPTEQICGPAQLDNCFDSVLLDHLLQKGERCFAFKYTKKISEHPILNEFKKEWAESVYAFYLKPSEFDRPLRVEFLHNGQDLTEHADKIAGIVFALASLHREYAFPSVLIEADIRAGLKPEEVELVFNKIRDKLSKKLSMQLRRNSRPF
jgi:hypothetical protein